LQALWFSCAPRRRRWRRAQHKPAQRWRWRPARSAAAAAAAAVRCRKHRSRRRHARSACCRRCPRCRRWPLGRRRPCLPRMQETHAGCRRLPLSPPPLLLRLWACAWACRFTTQPQTKGLPGAIGFLLRDSCSAAVHVICRLLACAHRDGVPAGSE